MSALTRGRSGGAAVLCGLEHQVRFIPHRFAGHPLRFATSMAVMCATSAMVGILSARAGVPINLGVTAAAMMLGSWMSMPRIGPKSPVFWVVGLGGAVAYGVWLQV